jgi:cellulose synthase/poly-beta-1,6-N-acetylglucosamine synthase-like glycosyltransferase
MTRALELCSAALTLGLAPFFLFLAMITIAALVGRRSGPGAPTGKSRFLIVIPAHDEEGAIASTVRSCRELGYPPELFSIWVIADNCTDATARQAGEAGAFVVERFDPALRSKGHALEYFFTQVPEAKPDSAGYDAAVLIDADTSVDPGMLWAFDAGLAGGRDWIQGYYTVRNPDASWRTRLMTYAFSLSNGVWMLGLERLGLGVGLKGNGMCFSARGLRQFPWRAYGLVEDMEFAWMLRTRGERIRFLPEARVFGEMVSRGGPGAASQRRRWEAGRRALRGKFAGPLARSGSIGAYPKVMYLLDLFFPPLVTLALGLAAASTIAAVAAAIGGPGAVAGGLLATQGVMACLLILYAVSPALVMKLPARYLASLLALPYYVVWKLSVAAGRKPNEWVRTPREPQAPGRDPL